jgi:hypothetical protein
MRWGPRRSVYQGAFLDPAGRSIMMGFRKLFF